jgi:hypothetical protein
VPLIILVQNLSVLMHSLYSAVNWQPLSASVAAAELDDYGRVKMCMRVGPMEVMRTVSGTPNRPHSKSVGALSIPVKGARIKQVSPLDRSRAGCLSLDTVKSPL